jgi:hypothetical protein
MTEVYLSPDAFQRKRRAVFELSTSTATRQDDESSAYMEPADDCAFLQRITVSNKKVKGINSYSVDHSHCIQSRDENDLNDSNVTMAESEYRRPKRHCPINDPESRPAHFNTSYQNELQRYHDSIITSMQTECQLLLSNKDEEMRRMKSDHDQFAQHISGELSHCQEENKLLKRAILLQDGKLRDLTQQHIKLQQLASSAGEHIMRLEDKHRVLIDELNKMKFSSFHHVGMDFRHPPPPPDVF